MKLDIHAVYQAETRFGAEAYLYLKLGTKRLKHKVLLDEEYLRWKFRLFFYCASEAEAHHIQSYIKTRFFRFMVSLRKITQDATRNTYQWVPQQDFSAQSQFDWDSSTAELERALYDKYQLSTEERAYIERMVKVQG